MQFMPKFSNQNLLRNILFFMLSVYHRHILLYYMPMALIHVSFNHQRKKFLSETDLTHTAAVHAMPCKYNARHIADTLTHYNCATNEATSFRLNILKLWSKGTVPVIGLYEVKVGKLSEALNKNF